MRRIARLWWSLGWRFGFPDLLAGYSGRERDDAVSERTSRVAVDSETRQAFVDAEIAALITGRRRRIR